MLVVPNVSKATCVHVCVHVPACRLPTPWADFFPPSYCGKAENCAFHCVPRLFIKSFPEGLVKFGII